MTASASQAFSAQCVCLKVESAKMLEQRDSHAAEGFFQEIHPDVLRVWSAEGLGKFDSDCIVLPPLDTMYMTIKDKFISRLSNIN